MSNVSLSRELVNQALEALEADNSKLWPSEKRAAAITALRAALAQQDEPVESTPFDWPRKACPCRDVQHGECLTAGCKWERDPSLVPQHLRQPPTQAQQEEPVAWKQGNLVTFNAAPPQRKPLSLKDVERLIYENTKINPNVADDKELLGYIVNAIRAVERAHNIME